MESQWENGLKKQPDKTNWKANSAQDTAQRNIKTSFGSTKISVF